jgi:hypothetical protein
MNSADQPFERAARTGHSPGCLDMSRSPGFGDMPEVLKEDPNVVERRAAEYCSEFRSNLLVSRCSENLTGFHY